MSKLLYIFDIDGVLSDNRKAMQEAGPEPDRAVDKELHSKWVTTVMKDFDQHPPVAPLFLLLRRLYTDNYTPAVVLTARNEEHRAKTEEWLRRQFPSGPMPRLVMRPRHNYWNSGRLKEELILDLIKQHEATSVVWIDDDQLSECPEICQRHGWIFLKAFLGA